MSRIQWTPIVAPDISESAIRAQQAAGQAVQGAFGSFTGLLNDWEGARQRDEMGQLIARQEAFVGQDSALYDAARRNGTLTRGLTYLRPEALAGAVRTFGADLERDYRGDIAFADNRVDRTFTLGERQRGITEREAGIQVALGRERIRAEVAAGRMTEQQAVAETAALAAQAETADQITGAFGAVRDGTQDNRGNTRWDREGVTYADSRVDRTHTLALREAEEQGLALAQKYVNFQGTNEDLMADPAYQAASPRAQALALATLGRGPAVSDAGSVDGGGGSDFAGAGSGGINGNYDQMLVTLESGGNTNARARTSSATGLHQFTTRTWLNTVRSAGFPWAQGKSDQQLLALRSNPEYSTQAERHLRSQNTAALERARLPVNNVNLYAMHHFSPAEATAFARAGGGTRSEQLFSDATIAANPYLRGKTKAEVIANWDRRSGGNGNIVQRVATDLAVGAGVARASDRFGPQARNIAAALSSDASDQEVMASLRVEGSPFANMPEPRIGRILREIQDRHRANGGGRLPRAAAAQVALASMTDYDAGKDGWRNLIGRSSGIGSTGGPFATATHTINWTDVDQQLSRFRNGGAALASDVRNEENRVSVAAAATNGRAQLQALASEIARLEQTAQRNNQPNNPVLLELRRRYANLLRQYGSLATDGTAVIRAGA